MATKEKVLASCKTSYAKYGLKKDELSKMVDQIIASRGLTDESTDEDVTKAITAVEPYVGMMQQSFNRAVSETESKYKGWVKRTDPPVPPTPPAPKTPPTNAPLTADDMDIMIAYAKSDQQKAIADEADSTFAP